jgi:uncharacterized repeat protein (TIGR02543 family)
MTINLQGSRTSPDEPSDWEVAEVYIFNSILSAEKMLHLEAMLNHKYGLTGFTASTLDTFDYASSGDLTLYAQWNSTITYNGNGQTSASSTVPAATTAMGVSGSTTLANAGTMVRTGFTLSGWNTQADGLGTNYATGATYQATGNVTLYARWTATITFNPNGATGSPATSSNNATPKTSQVFINSITAIPVADLPTVGTMVRPGFTFEGWNTANTGAGTNFSPAEPRPYMRFKSSDFNDATNTWTDSSGNKRHIPGTAVTASAGNIRGNPTLVDATGNGATENFKAVKGSTADGIVLGNEALANFTFCHVARYAGTNRKRIFTGVTGNFLSGYYNGNAGMAYSERWITHLSGTNDTNWRVMCHTGGTTSGFRSNGVDRTTDTNNTTALPANMTINLQGSRTSPDEPSDWEVAEVIIYPQILNTFQLETLESSLKATYGITAYTPPVSAASAGSYLATGNTTLFARWTANGYSLTFDTSTVTSGVMQNRGFTAGTSFSMASNTFARTGHTFKNWNTQANGSGTTYTNGQSVTLFNDLTLYPQWNLITPGVPTVAVSAGNTEVRVTPTAAAASGTTVGPTTSMTVTAYTSAGVLLSPSKTCSVVSPATSCLIEGLTNGTEYKFGATATNATGTSAESTRVNGTPTGVTVTFDATSNSGAMGSVSLTNRALTSGIATLTTSSAHGFVTGMRVTIAGATATFDGTYTISSTPTSTTFTYVRTGTSATVTSTNSSGTATLSTSATFNKGTPLVLPTASRAGYLFSGWYTTQSSDGALVGAAGATYSPTSALTLYARFSGIVYTINYSGNGNTGGTVPSTGSYETGSGAYVVGAGPTKVGYTFAGWNTLATGAGTTYQANATLTPSANVSLFAKWTAASRTVTYALDGGTSSETTTQLTGKVIGDTVTLPASNTMSKTGYSFAGWSDGTNTFAGGATWTVPASDSNFTLTALWTLQTLSYRYELNGGTGTTPTSGTKKYNESLTLASATGITRAGYTFAGWNNGSLTKNAGETLTVTSNIVLVAQWGAITYSITYNGNSSTSGSVSAGTYTAGGVPYSIAANSFTRTGYEFAGWKTTADSSGTAYAVGAGYSAAANLTLYAQWNPATYIVSYNANGGTGSAPDSGSFVTGSAFTVSSNSGSLAKVGYTFDGWNTTADGSGTSAAAGATNFTTTQNVTLYAKWSPTPYTVTYNPGTGSGSVTSPGNKVLGATFTIETATTLTAPAASGAVSYEFAFWNDGSSNYRAGETYRMPAANVVLTAQWVAIYNVTYNGNGGTTNIAAVQKVENDTITVGIAAARTGYNFVKWIDQSGGLFSPGETTTVTSGRYIFSATWQVIERTLSFNLASGSGTAPTSMTGKTIGEIVTLPTTNGTRKGYTFGGWSSGGATYPAGGSFTVGDAHATFTATWLPNTNTIIYNGNGATSGTAPANGSYVTGANPGYSVSANSGTLAKTGFTFSGWYTTESGTSGSAYAESATVTTIDSDLTLYAKWNAASYAVTYSTDGGSANPTQANTAYGSTFTLPNAPTKSGFTFTGWQVNSVNYPAGSSFVMGATDLNFLAQWSGIYYVITYALNGGAGATPTQADVASGGSFTTAAAPSKSGFTFTGWSDGETTTASTTLISNVTGNKTLTAQWTIAAPGVPGTPTATPGNGSATITIVAPSTGGTASSYTVTASPGGGTCTVTAPATSCTISPLTNGTAYTFTASASNSAGNSDSSSTASAAVTPAGLPEQPTSVAGSGTGGSINLSWSAPSSDGGSAITDYIVEYRVSGGANWSTFNDGVSSSTSATITGLAAGSPYQFRVTTRNLIGDSAPSIGSPAIDTLATPPTITGATRGDGQVTLTWSAPTHLGSGSITGEQYEVIAYNSAGERAGSCNPASGALTCVVSGLTNGLPYTFKVEAETTIGRSALSSASAAVTPAGAPSAPGDVVAVSSGSAMTITFTAPTSNGGSAITSYTVASNPAGATCTLGASATTYTCSGLTAGTTYTYTVVAVNAVGSSSASPASEGLVAVAVPSAPLNVEAVITAGSTTLSATVSFTKPANENGSEILSYTVTASPGGATCTVSAPTTYCDIPVLPDNKYTFTVTARNAVGTSASSTASLTTSASNGAAPTLKVDPIPAPTGELVENKVLNSNTTTASYEALPNAVITYQWKRCTIELDESTCSNISGATSATYTTSSSDVDKYLRVSTTATNSIGTLTSLSGATAVIAAAPAAPAPAPASSSSSTTTEPAAERCNSACQASRDKAAADKAAADAVAKAAADKAAADAVAKAAADKAAADAVAKAAADKAAADATNKLKSDAEARVASDKAASAAKAAADAAKLAVEKASEAAVAKAAADAATAAASARAKAAADAQAAADKAAADAQATLKSRTASAAEKATATTAANKASAEAAAAVKAAADAARNERIAKSAAVNANKQVDIAINSLTSKTASAKATAEANAIAAAAKAAANQAAAATAAKAAEAKALASNAQKAAAEVAARISTEQKAAAAAATAAKTAAEAAARASDEKIKATQEVKAANEVLVKVLNEKVDLAEQAAKATDESVRAELNKKISEIDVKIQSAEEKLEAANDSVEEALDRFEEASVAAKESQETAEESQAKAVEVKEEATKAAAVASKAVAEASVAAKVAAAAQAAAAKVPAKAVITPKASSSTNKNTAKATVTGLKPGQKVKVTVNVKKP